MNCQNHGDGTKNCACFSNLKRTNIPLTSQIQFPKCYQQGLPETIKTSIYLMLNMNTSGTIFFHPLFFEWNKLDNIRNSNRIVFLKNKSGQVLTVRLMCIILMELNCLQDYEFDQVICVNPNLETIFKIP